VPSGGPPTVSPGLPTGVPGRLLALALTAAMLGVIWIGAVAPLAGWYAARADVLAQRHALARRMAELAASLPALRAQAGAAAAPGPGPATMLEGESDAIAGAALQEAVQKLAASAGASLSSIEMLPSQPEGAYRPIRLHVSLNAQWANLVRLLAAIRGATPLMLVDDLHVNGVRLLVQPAAFRLDAMFTVTAFRPAGAPQARP